MQIYGSSLQPLYRLINYNNAIMENSELELKESNIATQANYDLNKGDFTTEESQEILSYLINKKINFHQLKSFSTEIRFGEVDTKSSKRCEELIESKAFISKFIQSAKEQGKTLRIKSTVTIEAI